METSQIMYLVILFLIAGIIELFVLVGALVSQRRMNKYGSSANMIGIVSILGILFLVTAIILGVNFVKAFDNDDAKVKSLKKSMSNMDSQTNYLLSQISSMDADSPQMEELQSQIIELENNLDDAEEDLDDFDESSGMPLWLIQEWFY